MHEEFIGWCNGLYDEVEASEIVEINSLGAWLRVNESCTRRISNINSFPRTKFYGGPIFFVTDHPTRRTWDTSSQASSTDTG